MLDEVNGCTHIYTQENMLHEHISICIYWHIAFLNEAHSFMYLLYMQKTFFFPSFRGIDSKLFLYFVQFNYSSTVLPKIPLYLNMDEQTWHELVLRHDFC